MSLEQFKFVTGSAVTTPLDSDDRDVLNSEDPTALPSFLCSFV